MSQSEQLMKIANGVVNFCTEMRTYLENTKESFDRVLNANYHVNTAPIITKTLEQEYEDILATNGDYEYSSAVGYRAILKNGDTIKATVNSGNSGHFFLNGERMTADYTYTGDGCEMVSVWVFENVGSAIVVPPTLNDTPSFTPYEINIKNIGQTPIVTADYYLYADKITTYCFTLPTSPRAARIIKADGTNDFSQVVSAIVREVSSDCEKFSKSTLRENKCVETIKLPNCKELNNINSTMLFYGLSSIKNWEFGKLKIINGITTTTLPHIMFGEALMVYIPETVKTINGTICNRNNTIKLDCKNATSIYNGWCYGPPTNFTMAKDWLASVNIAVAARNWNKEKFIDLFENYLFDLSVVGDDGTLYAERELTIPKAIYDVLTDEEFAIAENKGWIVGGA